LLLEQPERDPIAGQAMVWITSDSVEQGDLVVVESIGSTSPLCVDGGLDEVETDLLERSRMSSLGDGPHEAHEVA